MCVVIRTHLDTRFFPRGGRGREACAGTLAPATKHAPAYMSLNFYFTLVPDTAPHESEHILGVHYRSCPCVLEQRPRQFCVVRYTYTRYVVCIVSEGGTLFLHVRVFRLYSYPSSIYVLTLTPPSDVPATKKKLRGKTNLASIPNDRCNRVVIVYE